MKGSEVSVNGDDATPPKRSKRNKSTKVLEEAVKPLKPRKQKSKETVVLAHPGGDQLEVPLAASNQNEEVAVAEADLKKKRRKGEKKRSKKTEVANGSEDQDCSERVALSEENHLSEGVGAEADSNRKKKKGRKKRSVKMEVEVAVGSENGHHCSESANSEENHQSEVICAKADSKMRKKKGEKKQSKEEIVTECSENAENGGSQNVPASHSGLGNVEIQDMLFDPRFQVTAVQMFGKAMFNCVNSDGSPEKTSQMTLRNQTPPTNECKRSADNDKKNDDEEGSESPEYSAGIETADRTEHYVVEVLKRYNENRKMQRPKRRSQAVLSETDSEIDESVLDEDLEAYKTGKSNFMKYAVPQHDLKEKLWEKHSKVSRSLTLPELTDFCNEVMPELQGIKNETVPSYRHDEFKKVGLSHEHLLANSTSLAFSQDQEQHVIMYISKRLFGLHVDLCADNAVALRYLNCVLLPEALSRIFARVNHIDVALAEKQLRFQDAYDGELPVGIVQTLMQDEEMRDENYDI